MAAKQKEKEHKEVKPDQRTKTLDATVKEIKDRFGEGAIMKLGEVRRVAVDSIPTGSLSLDLALGVDGIPKGRIIEIYGPESSGKTTLVQHIVAQVQKRGGLAAFVDAEHAMDPEYAKRTGVKINDLLISQPDTAEQALEIVETLVRSGVVAVVVIDSVAALAPRAEIEGEMGDQHVALQARLMSHALRKLNAVAARNQVTVIFTNQIRMKIGVMFGNPETTPGGKALKFFSSVRIEVRRAAQIKKGDQIVGNRVKAKVVKNKVAPPFKTAEFDIMYNEGISYEGDVLNTGVKYAILERSGTWFTYGNQKLGQGLDASKQYLKDNPQITKKIVEDIKKKAAVSE